jgi:hypothetical protein
MDPERHEGLHRRIDPVDRTRRMARHHVTQRVRDILVALGIRQIGAQEQERRWQVLRDMEQRNVIAARPPHMPRFRVTDPISLTLVAQSYAAARNIDLAPGTVVRYSHRGRLQFFDEPWGRSWSISHNFLLPDDREVTHVEFWSSEDGPTGPGEAVCLSPFPPTGMVRSADDPSTPH